MTSSSRQQFTSTIRHGDPHAVRYYREAVRMVLAGCKLEDLTDLSELNELYPFGGNSSSLAYAVWRIGVDEFLSKRGAAKPNTVRAKVDLFIRSNGLTSSDLARMVGISYNATTKIRGGYKCQGKDVDRVISFILDRV